MLFSGYGDFFVVLSRFRPRLLKYVLMSTKSRDPNPFARDRIKIESAKKNNIMAWRWPDTDLLSAPMDGLGALEERECDAVYLYEYLIEQKQKTYPPVFTRESNTFPPKHENPHREMAQEISSFNFKV
jgi:hypothetical protein